MNVNYDLIIKYLSKKKLNITKEKSINIINNLEDNISKIEKFKNKYHNELEEYSFLRFKSDNNLVDSIIYLLNNEKFTLDKKIMEKNRNELLNLLDDSNLPNICKYFNINILLISDQIELYSSSNIINLSLPFILLYKENNYYPLFLNEKRIFFYQGSEIEDLLDKDFVVNYDNYQLLDNTNEIIDQILDRMNDKETKSNDIFINSNNLEYLEKIKKYKKVDLINEILNKSDYKKSNLQKMRKDDLIRLLGKI